MENAESFKIKTIRMEKGKIKDHLNYLFMTHELYEPCGIKAQTQRSPGSCWGPSKLRTIITQVAADENKFFLFAG